MTSTQMRLRTKLLRSHFVVGFGLDYAHYYRDLPYIAILDADDEVKEG